MDASGPRWLNIKRGPNCDMGDHRTLPHPAPLAYRFLRASGLGLLGEWRLFALYSNRF